jgi:DNA ligase (NAD+)
MVTSMARVESLVNRLTKARKAYYSSGKTIMSDAEYDRLEDELRQLSPSHSFFKKVGHSVRGKKVALPFAMGSLGKVKQDGSLVAWLKNCTFPIYASDKLDGVSALVYNDGNSIKFYTRGNGTVGQDITPLLAKIKGIGKLPKKVAIRGEALMSHKEFKGKLASEFANPRNLVSGIVNSKELHAATSKVSFVVHTSVKPKHNLPALKRLLEPLGWKVVKHTKFTSSSQAAEQIPAYLDMRRKKSLYLMDGLVLTDSKGDSIAFKGVDESATVKVSKVTWHVSRYGLLKPVVHFARATTLDGVQIKKATAHNARFITSNMIGKGAVVEIVLSNGVIPKVIGVIKKAAQAGRPNVPFRWDDNEVEYLLDDHENEDTKSIIVTSQLTHFLSSIGAEGTKGGLVSRLVENGINSIPLLLIASVKKLQKAGLGPVQASNLRKEIDAKVGEATHVELMVGSNVFPRGWGRRRIAALLREVPVESLSRMNKTELITTIQSMEGYSAILAKQFAEGFPKYLRFLSATGLTPKSPKALRRVSSSLSDQVIVFTGVRDRDLEKHIESNGGTVGTSVNSLTTILVVKSLSSGSSKMQKAKSLGVKIVELNAARKILLK